MSDLGTSYDLLRNDDQDATVPIRDAYAAIMKRAAPALVQIGHLSEVGDAT